MASPTSTCEVPKKGCLQKSHPGAAAAAPHEEQSIAGSSTDCPGKKKSQKKGETLDLFEGLNGLQFYFCF